MGAIGIGMAWLSNNRIKQIDQAIDDIYKQIGVARFPETDLLEIVTKCGINVYQYDFGADHRQVMGAIDFTQEKPTIYLNKYNHPNNQQFTLAHEFGHFRLNHTEGNVRFLIDFESDIYPKDFNIRQQELEANYFAGSILMPEDILTILLKQNYMIKKSTVEKIKILSKHFQVSEVALKTRLRWIGRNKSDIFNLLKL